jgi:hypothetical protein
LSQIDEEGMEKICAYGSRVLKKHEMHYGASELEALGVVWALTFFHYFLYGNKFLIRTDHSALKKLLRDDDSKKPMRIKRWTDILLQYDFNVEYVPGSNEKIVLADYISRHVVPSQDETSVVKMITVEDKEIKCTATLEKDIEEEMNLKTAEVVSPAGLSIMTAQDTALKKIVEFMKQGKWESDDDVKQFEHMKDDMFLYGKDCLARGDGRAVIPNGLRNVCLRVGHAGHKSISTMKKYLRQFTWWPKMDQDVEAFCKSCCLCTKSSRFDNPIRTPTQIRTEALHVYDTWSADVIGPLNVHGYPDYILTVIDNYSRWPVTRKLRNLSGNELEQVFKMIFLEYGTPENLCTDNGTNFTSHTFEQFLVANGVKHLKTAPYNPQANGIIERFNGFYKSNIMNLKIDKRKTWEEKNAEILFEYRNTKHTVTQVAPAKIFLDRYIRGGIIPLANFTKATGNESCQLRDTNQKEYNERLRRKNKNGKRLVEGDWVKVKCPPSVTHRKYGNPIQISEQIGPYTYMLTDGRKRNQRCLVKVPSI